MWSLFLNEWMDFRDRRGIYADKGMWRDETVRRGQSHLWHRKYSDDTKVLGFVGCKVTGKTNGIGQAERTWGGVKEVKTGKKAHLGFDQTEQRSIVYCSATMEAAQIARQHSVSVEPEREFNMFDLDYNLKMLGDGVDVATVSKKTPTRIFRCWIEEWEKTSRMKKKDDCERMLLNKYGGVRFQDPVTEKDMVVYSGNAEYHKKSKFKSKDDPWGWHLLGHDPAVNPEEEKDCFESYDLEIVIESMQVTAQVLDLQVIPGPA